MSGCDEHGLSILPYLDGELSEQEVDDFRAHLSNCPMCQQKLEEEEALSRLLHRSKVLYTAPASLRVRVVVASAAALASADTAGHAPERLWRRLFRFVECPLQATGWPILHCKALAAAALVILGGAAFLPNVVKQAKATSYVDTAVATHRSYLEGNLPLELRSESPLAVTQWFAGKVPFHFELPTSQAKMDVTPAYQMSGARLVNYRGSYAALVTYHMKAEKISLLVVSDKMALASGGDVVRFHELAFHHCKRDGFNVTTWSNHGLTYALVSSLRGSAQQSCLVCHQDMADKNDFSQ